MSWETYTLFTTSDLLEREGELLNGVSLVNRHDVVKHLLEERIKARYWHLEDPISNITEPSKFSEAAICLNLAMVLRENSSHKDDIFATRGEFYQRRFEEELERAFLSLQLNDEDAGVEIVR